MRMLWRVLPALIVLAATAGFTSAQGKDKKGPFGGFGGGQLRLLENADVQKDLELSEDQVTKVKEVAEKQAEGFKDLFKEGTDKKEIFAKMKELTAATQKAVDEILTDKQKTRVKQLEVQQRGPNALLFGNITKDLELTEEQTKKLREEFQKHSAEMQRAITAALVKTLTPEQQKKWREMTGEPFKGVLPAGGFGPGFGGGFGPPPGGEVRALPEGSPVRRRE